MDVETVARQNYEQFRDLLAAALVEKISEPQATAKKRKSRRRHDNIQEKAGLDPSQNSDGIGDNDQGRVIEELADFIDYMATEIFDSLPAELKAMDYYTWTKSPQLAERFSVALTADKVAELLPSLDPSLTDSLMAYKIIDGTTSGTGEFLTPILNAYLEAVTALPPAPRSTKSQATACELCGRDWVGLTYHHLIPRFVHAKVVKRGWHREDQLQNVAWLCRACHRFVHQFASHEDLARYYYTVELLLEQDQVVAFAGWVGKIRWRG